MAKAKAEHTSTEWWSLCEARAHVAKLLLCSLSTAELWLRQKLSSYPCWIEWRARDYFLPDPFFQYNGSWPVAVSIDWEDNRVEGIRKLPGELYHSSIVYGVELKRTDILALFPKPAPAELEPQSQPSVDQGGAPEKWDWFGVKKRKEPFESWGEGVKHVQSTVQRVDKKPRGKGPDRRSVKTAIKKHKLDVALDIPPEDDD
jgi:hypothetical protein